MRATHRIVTAAAVVVAVAATTPATSATSLDTGAVDYYRVEPASPVTTEDVLEAARAHDLRVLSVQHNGPTNGELIVGETDLATALETYRETDLQNFSTEPHVVSFTTSTPVTGVTVAGEPATVVGTSSMSADPTPAEVGDVTAANVTDPWAPRTGTLWAHNSSTGAARQMRHIMSWDSRSGLDSYKLSDAEFVYEHDTKIYDRDPYFTGAMGHQACGPDYWVSGETRIVTSNVPSSSKVYADNARASDDCGTYDLSFGIFEPWHLAVNTNYKIVVGANAGEAARSPFGIMGSKMVRSCGLESAWCVSLGSDPREDYDMFINEGRSWKMPGCFTWYRADSTSPVNGSC
jgi:hypothetical protein